MGNPRPPVLKRQHGENGLETAEPLTKREKEVLALIQARLSNPQIARELGTSPRTVTCQVQSIFGKLGCHSRHELIDKPEYQNFGDSSS